MAQKRRTRETSTKGTQGKQSRSRVEALLAEQDYAEAARLLQKLVLETHAPEDHARLAKALFHLEDYAGAARQIEPALSAEPTNDDWREIFALAKANSLAAVNVQVPEPVFFEREKLLRSPTIPPDILPEPLPPTAKSFQRKLFIAFGDALGVVTTLMMNLAIGLTGRLLGYRDRVWTNWYRRSHLIGILTLGYMREKLNRNNLKNAYPPGRLVGFLPTGLTPPLGVTHFRTADGSWNNLSNPKEGAAGTRFHRNVNNEAIQPESVPQILDPNPRLISQKLLARGKQMKEVPFLNMLAAAWINFENHDWIHHGESMIDDYFTIPLADDDPAQRKFGQTELRVGKTQADPTRLPNGEKTPITFVNEVTHWWDGSQVYGSDQETVDRLRSGTDGKLRLTEEETLPLDDKGIETTGFARNWWVGLTLLHTLFAREHNAICNRLRQSYPAWDDPRLFNVARLINAAVMAKIHSVEWTPAILPNRGLDSGLNANWYGLLTNLLRNRSDRKTYADINVRNPELGGVVGNPIDKHGQPYGLTEEFVEVYRLHSLLPETIQVRSSSDEGEWEEIPFVATRQAGSAKLTARFGISNLIYSFGVQHPGQLVLHNYPNFMREFSIPGTPLFDMATVDILRARERGVPRYNEFRRQLGLNPIARFEDLTDESGVADDLRAVYGDGPEAVEKLDLMVGTLAEGHRPTGFGFGETLFQIFILNASRRLQADRFYTDAYNEDVYTPEGLDWIDEATLKSVILRHYPELSQRGLSNVTNAFEPWDRGERLDPNRHPLRAFDSQLKPDPWIGDAYRQTNARRSSGLN